MSHRAMDLLLALRGKVPRDQDLPRKRRLFTMLSSFGTPPDVTADELHVERFFPLDAESQALLRRLAI